MDCYESCMHSHNPEKTFGFLQFLGGIEMKHLPDMG